MGWRALGGGNGAGRRARDAVQGIGAAGTRISVSALKAWDEVGHRVEWRAWDGGHWVEGTGQGGGRGMQCRA